MLLWYLIFRPSGAILYRLAAYLAARWRNLGGFARFAEQAFHVLEWPACGHRGGVRTRRRLREYGVLLAHAGAHLARSRRRPPRRRRGAMGVRLGMPVQEMDGLQPRPELGVEEADGPFLDTTVGMLWRALVLWVAVLAGAAIVAHSSRFWS